MATGMVKPMARSAAARLAMYTFLHFLKLFLNTNIVRMVPLATTVMTASVMSRTTTAHTVKKADDPSVVLPPCPAGYVLRVEPCPMLARSLFRNPGDKRASSEGAVGSLFVELEDVR